MPFSKKQALSVVFSAAVAYKHNLANKTVLFLGMDKHYRINCLEAAFDESNFNHLTGLKTKMNPKHFFGLCLDRRLSEDDFWLSPDGTTELKLKALPQVVKSDLSARMIGYYNECCPKLYTEILAGGVKACIGFKRDEKSGLHVPNTLLNEDIRNLTVGAPDRIVLTCSKKRSDSEYLDVVYRAKRVDWERIEMPECCRRLQMPEQ